MTNENFQYNGLTKFRPQKHSPERKIHQKADGVCLGVRQIYSYFIARQGITKNEIRESTGVDRPPYSLDLVLTDLHFFG